MGLTTGSKNKLYLSATAPAAFTEEAWGDIAEADWFLAPCPSSIPEIVRRLEQVTFDCLHSGSTETARGAAAPITFNPPIRDEPGNPAQQVAEAAMNATNGTDAELVSIRVQNDGATQTFYLQARVYGYGSGERVTNTVFLRVLEMTADANTMVEVNA